MRKGIVTMVGLLLFPIFAFAQGPVDVKPPQQKILSSHNGRYAFGQFSDSSKDQFLLDTRRGRLWQIVVGAEGYRKLQPVPFISIWADEVYIPDPKTEIEGQREQMLMKQAEDLRRMLDSQKQEGKKE